MFYEFSIEQIRKRIGSQHQPVRNEEGRHTFSHVLWMCEQIEAMNEYSILAAFKAGRWIGWIFAVMEMRSAEWTNGHSRNFARWDHVCATDCPKGFRFLARALRR